MTPTRPGEVWRVDFGLAAKVRPALILGSHPRQEDLALVMVIPHTTSLRGNRWELHLAKPFLKEGAFHLQQLQPIPLARLQRRLGIITNEELAQVKAALVRLLDLAAD